MAGRVGSWGRGGGCHERVPGKRRGGAVRRAGDPGHVLRRSLPCSERWHGEVADDPLRTASDRVPAQPAGPADDRRYCALDRRLGRLANPPSADPCMAWARSEEHTSELQSLMRISYAVFCLKKK